MSNLFDISKLTSEERYRMLAAMYLQKRVTAEQLQNVFTEDELRILDAMELAAIEAKHLLILMTIDEIKRTAKLTYKQLRQGLQDLVSKDVITVETEDEHGELYSDYLYCFHEDIDEMLM